MLFGVVFKEKNAKKKQKKAGSGQNLLPNISTRGALQNILETGLGSSSAGLQFSFIFIILGNRSCDHHPDDPLDEPWKQGRMK